MENIKNRKFALLNGLGLPGGLTPDNFEAQWHANHQVQLNISNCSGVVASRSPYSMLMWCQQFGSS